MCNTFEKSGIMRGHIEVIPSLRSGICIEKHRGYPIWIYSANSHNHKIANRILQSTWLE